MACGFPLASVLAGGRRAYITQTDIASKFMADLDPYDQYEASFPMEVAGTCLQQVCYSLLQCDRKDERRDAGVEIVHG